MYVRCLHCGCSIAPGSRCAVCGRTDRVAMMPPGRMRFEPLVDGGCGRQPSELRDQAWVISISALVCAVVAVLCSLVSLVMR